MRGGVALVVIGLAGQLSAQSPVQLPSVSVTSTRVAIQAPVATYAMPVSALRFEPLVDLQARNLGEAQSDVIVRGGVFEATGFRIGATTLLDPQTGHYGAEIPVAPSMLTEPRVVTGADLATGLTNGTSGGLAYDWRRIQTGGLARLGGGQFRGRQAEVYQGYTAQGLKGQLAADVAVSHSRGEGGVRYGEHRFDRVNIRLQRSSQDAQTDLFAGYQAKFFGWPNLYTPFNSNETEDLQTTLFALHHRQKLGGGGDLEMGVSHRRNKDDYAFNRFAPVGPVHPFQHTTWLDAASFEGRQKFGAIVVSLRAEVLADRLKSTSLTFGRFRSRTLSKTALALEQVREVSGDPVRIKGGLVYDDSNHDGSVFSPLVEVVRTLRRGGDLQIYATVSRSTQLPTYTALNSNPAAGLFRGNPNLGRQYSRNFEVGLRGVVDGWASQVATFLRDDDGQVDWTFRRGVTARTANAVNLRVAGFEVMTRRSWRKLDVVLGYTTLAKSADYRGALVDASFYALNYAKHRVTAAFTLRVNDRFELRMDNVARWQADNLLRTVGGDQAVLSCLSTTYRPQAFPGFELSAGVENLWDRAYQEVPGVPAAPRRWSAGLAHRW
jgi:vitamin B12 transporter